MSEKRKIIAIDFDGVLCRDAWPGIGEENSRILALAKFEKKEGAALILWTCRCGEYLDAAVEWCRERGLELDAVNENLPERVALYGSESRKISADEYWDDRAWDVCTLTNAAATIEKIKCQMQITEGGGRP